MLVNSPLLLDFKTNIDIPSSGVYLLDGGTSEAHSHPWSVESSLGVLKY